MTSPITSLFTATSAICVTGLVVVDTGTYWSEFGKVIIVILIQIGGLGFMTMTSLIALIIGKKISFKEKVVLQESFNRTSLQGVVGFVKRVVIITFSIEALGAMFLSFTFIPLYGLTKGLAYSFFHSVSAFCKCRI